MATLDPIYDGPFREAERRPWDGEPWRTASPPLPQDFLYLPIVRFVDTWFAQVDRLRIDDDSVTLLPLRGTEAVAPFRSPASVVAAIPDEGRYYLVYDHDNEHPRQVEAVRAALTISPRVVGLDEFTELIESSKLWPS